MLDYALLEALRTVIRCGSFERAAKELNLTQPAISHRIKLLEERIGSVLVQRGQPCVPTLAGAALCGHTERVQWLEAELRQQLPIIAGVVAATRPVLRIAVNEDSLATWFVDVIGSFCKERGALLDLVVEDQDHTVETLRSGGVQGAITTMAEPVQGCRSVELGRMLYVAACSPDFFETYFRGGVNRNSLADAPCLSYYRNDALQYRFLKRVTGEELRPPMHWIPNVAGYLRMCEAGLGWGMFPLPMVDDRVRSGRLIEVMPGERLDSVLYWQSWRLSVPLLDDLLAEIRLKTRAHLVTVD